MHMCGGTMNLQDTQYARYKTHFQASTPKKSAVVIQIGSNGA
jgi:hypothetical protein